MEGLSVTRDPAALHVLLNETLYAIPEPEKADGAAEAGGTEIGGEAEASGTVESSKANSVAGVAGKEAAAGRRTEADRVAEVGKEAADRAAGASRAASSQEVLHYLGENRRFILVLVNYPDEDFLPEAEKAYLSKIFKAVNLELEDIALLNIARYPDRDYAALKEFFAFTSLLLFGVSPQEIQVPGPVFPYHSTLMNETRILAADSTEQLRPNKEKKRALWEQLQQLFK